MVEPVTAVQFWPWLTLHLQFCKQSAGSKAANHSGRPHTFWFLASVDPTYACMLTSSTLCAGAAVLLPRPLPCACVVSEREGPPCADGRKLAGLTQHAAAMECNN